MGFGRSLRCPGGSTQTRRQHLKIDRQQLLRLICLFQLYTVRIFTCHQS